MRKFLLLLPLLYLVCTLNAQTNDVFKPFLKIDSVYLPEKKGRVELRLSRFSPTFPWRSFSLPNNYILKESGVTEPLKLIDGEFLPEQKHLFVYYNFQSNKQLTQKFIQTLFSHLNKSKSAKIPIDWNLTIIGDSSNYYNWSTFRVSEQSQKSYEKIYTQTFKSNLSDLHKQFQSQFEGTIFIPLADAYNINNMDATINRLVGKASEGITNVENQVRIIPYIIDQSTPPDILVQYLSKTKFPFNEIITDPNLSRLRKYLDDKILNRFAYKIALNFDPARPLYTGEIRTLNCALRSKSDLTATAEYTFGSPDFPLNVKEFPGGLSFWITCIFTGLMLVALLFFLWSIWFPLQEDKKFFKKYVKKYEPLPNIVKYDTLTNEPIEKGTLVVTKCSEVVPYYIWIGIGNQCPNYPDCMDYLGCQGNGSNETKYRFFSQAGPMRKYNWSFYGAAGGFLAWLNTNLFILIFNALGMHKIFDSLYKANPEVKLNALHFSYNCVNQAGVGFGIGIGLGAALIIADYFSSIIRPKIAFPILKITLAGIASGLLFVGTYILSYHFQINNYIIGIVTWILFGLILALFLSFKSPNVTFKRGVKAIGIGVLISFVLYHVVTMAINSGYKEYSPTRNLLLELFKILRLWIMGAITGWFATASLERSEDYELEILGPDNVRGRKVPISKILKSGMPISIGSSPKNVLFVKWTDPGAEEDHAKLDYDNSNVILTAHAEIIINKEYLSKGSKHILQNGDVIQLGRHSVTLLKFNVKDV